MLFLALATDLHPKRDSRGLGRPHEVVVWGRLRTAYRGNALQARRDFLQHRHPLSDDAFLVQQDAREIAARPRHSRDEA